MELRLIIGWAAKTTAKSLQESTCRLWEVWKSEVWIPGSYPCPKVAQLWGQGLGLLQGQMQRRRG